jgi:hypothetical protein
LTGAPAFLDANIVVYATGVPHPYREPCTSILALGRETRGAFLTSAEVMQEILNLGVRRGELSRATLALSLLATAAGRVEPLLPQDVLRAVTIDVPRLSARDRIHLAVMQRIDCSHIVSTDRAYDGLPGITRLDPMEFESWRADFTDDSN